MLPAGGAPEIELCQQLQKYGRSQTGLDQYAIAKYAESFEVSHNSYFGVSACHTGVPIYSIGFIVPRLPHVFPPQPKTCRLHSGLTHASHTWLLIHMS